MEIVNHVLKFRLFFSKLFVIFAAVEGGIVNYELLERVLMFGDMWRWFFVLHALFYWSIILEYFLSSLHKIMYMSA